MSQFRVSHGASQRLDEIHNYTRERWGEVQAERYIRGLFDKFAAIAERRFPRRPVLAEFEIDSYFVRYERHYIYWKRLADCEVGIVTILHERLHQLDRFSLRRAGEIWGGARYANASRSRMFDAFAVNGHGCALVAYCKSPSLWAKAKGAE